MNPTKPTTVAFLRGLVLAALAAIAALLVQVSEADAGDLGPYVPVIVLAGRYLEGWVLDRRQAPQAGPLGGSPATGA